jgi:hypothetical protein
MGGTDVSVTTNQLVRLSSARCYGGGGRAPFQRPTSNVVATHTVLFGISSSSSSSSSTESKMSIFTSGDSVDAIVADIGSYATKIGQAGEDYPRAYFRSVRDGTM